MGVSGPPCWHALPPRYGLPVLTPRPYPLGMAKDLSTGYEPMTSVDAITAGLEGRGVHLHESRFRRLFSSPMACASRS
jgi:hypothetical protein